MLRRILDWNNITCLQVIGQVWETIDFAIEKTCTIRRQWVLLSVDWFNTLKVNMVLTNVDTTCGNISLENDNLVSNWTWSLYDISFLSPWHQFSDERSSLHGTNSLMSVPLYMAPILWWAFCDIMLCSWMTTFLFLVWVWCGYTLRILCVCLPTYKHWGWTLAY